MADKSNLGRVKFGTARSAASDIAPVSTIPITYEIPYPTTTAINIATCFNIPLP